jgi:hypothetical protein
MMLKCPWLLIATFAATSPAAATNHFRAPQEPSVVLKDTPNEKGGRWAPLGEPLILTPNQHEAGLLVNQPLIGFRHMSTQDSLALCPSNVKCASIPQSFFRNSPEFKESSCKLSEAGVQAINHEKYNGLTGITKPLAELCREMYSLQNCIDSKGAVTDKEYLSNREYLTGVQCLRQQEAPFGCQCVPFSTPSLISHREELTEYMIMEDGTKVPRPADFPLAHFLSDKKVASIGVEGGTGGGTGGGATGGGTGGGATGEEEDPFRIVDEKINNIESQ